jgi:hypothetical protein
LSGSKSHRSTGNFSIEARCADAYGSGTGFLEKRRRGRRLERGLNDPALILHLLN